MVMDALGRAGSVLVLGGTSEIGLATARRLVADGARRVVLAGRDPAALSAAAGSLGGVTTVETAVVDAGETAGHAAFVADVFDRHGDFDVVLVTVGMLAEQAAVDADPGLAVAMAETNYVGPASLSLHAAGRLQQQGHGVLVVLSSVAGERVRPANYAYGSSKAGLDGLAQGLGHALADSGVQVMVVRPGFVRTRMTAGMEAAPFAVEPDDVAEAIAKGLERGSATVWVPPVLRWVMAVMRHLPAPLFRRLPS